MTFLHHLTAFRPELVSQIKATVKIDNDPYMTPTVENIGPGPRGLPALSICHYGEQNGDLMRDPEMCFEMQIEDCKVKKFHPYHFRDDLFGLRAGGNGPQHRPHESAHRPGADRVCGDLEQQP